MNGNYKFFINRKCEYFPCHKGIEEDKFNCLFCYCPLYKDDNCGGKFTMILDEIKDCSECKLPHIKDKGYEHIQKKLGE